MSSQREFIQKSKKPIVAYFIILVLVNLIFISSYAGMYFLLETKLFIYLFCQLFLMQISAPVYVKSTLDAIGGVIYWKKTMNSHLSIINNTKLHKKDLPWVAIVVPVFNDFMPNEIEFTFNQKYPNIKKYILDDSTSEDMKKQVDDFAKKHNVVVLRSSNWRKEYYGKNGLSRAFDYFINKTRGQWDYMIHVDSGDVLMPDHAIKAIKLFESNRFNNLGVVCVNYKAIKLNNKIQNLLGVIHDNSMSPSCLFSTKYGNYLMPGAGVVYKSECVYKVKEWPNTQCEDGAMSYKILQLGYSNLWTNSTCYGERQPLTIAAHLKRIFRISCGTCWMIKDKYIHFKQKKDTGTTLNMMPTFWWPVMCCFLLIIFFAFPTIGIFLPFNAPKSNQYFVVLISCLFIVGFLASYLYTFFYSIYLLIKGNKYFWAPFVNIVLSPALMFISCFSVIKVFILNKRNNFIVTQKSKSANKINKSGLLLFITLLVFTLIVLALFLLGIFFLNFHSIVNIGIFYFFFSFLLTQLITSTLLSASVFAKDKSNETKKIQLIY